MKKLFTEKEYKEAKELNELPLECYNCGEKFYKTKITIRNAKNPKRGENCKHCSSKCIGEAKTKKVKVNCVVCKKEIERHPSQLKIYPKSYCGKSCASKYSNTHKTKGSNRSKLELWLEVRLKELYPTLTILYNDVKKIKAELDIFIPELMLAFEINGIFHYEPIFGESKLNKTIGNDAKKFKLCIENNISLCVIDSTELKYFKPERAQKFLDIITNIINENI